MQQLNYNTLQQQGGQVYLLQNGPEKILQFGEGNFLRAFVDYFVDIANEKCGFNAKVVVAQPIEQGLAGLLNEQEGLYTLYLRGFENGAKVDDKRIISCISRGLNPYTEFDALMECAKNPELRYIVSNTTEAGIVYDPACKFEDRPASSFPAKLTRFLFERFTAFNGSAQSGVVILSCELIDNNGAELKRCVQEYCSQWNLSSEFVAWVEANVLFCNTLVDRIVTGYPRGEAEALNQQNGYEDKLLAVGEVFGLWVIEGPQSLAQELPFAKAGLPVMVVPDHTPYKQRKVRILNGAHTSMVPAAYLAGQDIVRECMDDAVITDFMNGAIYDEIIPTLTLPEEELKTFAASVEERFKNPFIDHSLLAIALNSTAKWRARVLPSVKGYLAKNNTLPRRLVFSFAAYLTFYNGIRKDGTDMIALRTRQDGTTEEYRVKDDEYVLDLFLENKGEDNEELVKAICGNLQMWGENLNELAGFTQAVVQALDEIQTMGMAQALKLYA